MPAHRLMYTLTLHNLWSQSSNEIADQLHQMGITFTMQTAKYHSPMTSACVLHSGWTRGQRRWSHLIPRMNSKCSACYWSLWHLPQKQTTKFTWNMSFPSCSCLCCYRHYEQEGISWSKGSWMMKQSAWSPAFCTSPEVCYWSTNSIVLIL